MDLHTAYCNESDSLNLLEPFSNVIRYGDGRMFKLISQAAVSFEPFFSRQLIHFHREFDRSLPDGEIFKSFVCHYLSATSLVHTNFCLVAPALKQQTAV